jgi:hypothetical protein
VLPAVEIRRTLGDVVTDVTSASVANVARHAGYEILAPRLEDQGFRKQRLPVARTQDGYLQCSHRSVPDHPRRPWSSGRASAAISPVHASSNVIVLDQPAFATGGATLFMAGGLYTTTMVTANLRAIKSPS